MIAILLWLYKISFHAYPREFRHEFAEEMVAVFGELLTQQATKGRRALLVTGLQELYHLPVAVLRLHWRSWRKKRPGLQFIQSAYRSPFHPLPPANDGRFSRWQTLFEISPLLLIGSGLFTITYLQPTWIPAGWQHQWHDASGWVALVALPVFIIGLLRNLPRWSYPAGGLLVGHTLFTAQVQSMLIFWIGILFIGFSLILTAVYIHLYTQPLAPFLVRLARSLALDWTRTALGFYSMTPYVIISAFDDTNPNNRTAYFALALLVMIVSAVAYCRSQRQEQQFIALIAGITGALVVAALEQVVLHSQSLASLIGLSMLWAGMLTLFLLPMLASLLYRTWADNRSTQAKS